MTLLSGLRHVNKITTNRSTFLVEASPDTRPCSLQHFPFGNRLVAKPKLQIAIPHPASRLHPAPLAKRAPEVSDREEQRGDEPPVTQKAIAHYLNVTPRYGKEQSQI